MANICLRMNNLPWNLFINLRFIFSLEAKILLQKLNKNFKTFHSLINSCKIIIITNFLIKKKWELLVNQARDLERLLKSHFVKNHLKRCPRD